MDQQEVPNIDYDVNSEDSQDSDYVHYRPNISDDECLGDDEYKSGIDSDEADDEDEGEDIYEDEEEDIGGEEDLDGDESNPNMSQSQNESNSEQSEQSSDDSDKDKKLPLVNEAELESYRIWKKNCPFLYDLIIVNQLEWPSMTVQWCHSKQTKVNPSNYREYFSEKILFGTQTDGNHPNYLIVATQHTPVIDRNQIAACEGGVSHTKYAKLEHYVRIIHEGDVNRARYNPQNPFIIATSSSSQKNYIFDYSKHPSEPTSTEFKPDLILEHHQEEGFGLCWNNRKSNILATGSIDESICIWDINSNPVKSKTLSPINTFKAHEDSVNDVKWHYYHDSYLGSVGSDKMLKFWDLRMNDMKSAFYGRAHKDGINSLSFNPFCEYIILTASDDFTVALFDIRNLKHRLHSFNGHGDQVYDVNWSPYCETVFASSGRDKRLIFWDMTRINAPQLPEEAQEGPPEMIFIHGGHTNMIQDFSWHPHNQMVASVSTNNELHVFKPSIDIKLSI